MNKKPFLKWAGGKFKQVDRIKALLPKGKRLVIPFVGAGSVFLNCDGYDEYIINDINTDLIELYLCLRRHGIHLINRTSDLFTYEANSKEEYYERRDIFNEITIPYIKSSLFVYLNRHGFNGLCRYNKSGGYNVPFGDYKRPYFPRDEMEYFYKRIWNYPCFDDDVLILNSSFEVVFEQVGAGDVVYCDPPYVPLSDTANFTAYAGGAFTMRQQIELARLARSAATNGATVVISNHDTDITRRLYNRAKIQSFEVQRNISAKAGGRGKVRELLAVFD